VSQHEQFGVLRRGGAGEQHQPADQPDEDQVEQPQRHGPRSFPGPTARPSAQVTGPHPLLAPRRIVLDVHAFEVGLLIDLIDNLEAKTTALTQKIAAQLATLPGVPAARFWLKRKTISKRVRAKLAEVKDQLKRRRHQPIPEQGRWLASVVRGHLAYYAVPGNTDAVAAFRTQATRHWYKALRRRSRRTRLNWTRMNRLATRWIPPARVTHPFPNVRFDARTRGRSPVRCEGISHRLRVPVQRKRQHLHFLTNPSLCGRRDHEKSR
jgi:hypothetical protein